MLVRKRKPTGERMPNHTFANIMLSVYEILGLNSETETALSMKDQRNLLSFDFHQNFFGRADKTTKSVRDDGKIYNTQDAYNKIINTIDSQSIYSKEERREFFFRYEQLYNGLISRTLISNLTKDQIIKRYVNAIIPAIIALDIHKTMSSSKKTNSSHFYTHIHEFILSIHCPENIYVPKLVCQGIRNYLREYIKSLDFKQKVHLNKINEIIKNIRPGLNQRSFKIEKEINECQALSKKDTLKYDELKLALLSLNSLLLFMNKTELLPLLVSSYFDIKTKYPSKSEKLFHLELYIYNSHYDENLLYDLIDNIIGIENISLLDQDTNSVPDELYDTINLLEELIFDDTPAISNPNFIYNLHQCLIDNEKIPSVDSYLTLLNIITSLANNDIHNANEIINKVSFDELPLGYLTSAIAIIKLSLKIKLEREKIRNGTLISLINPILMSQGTYTEMIAVASTPKDMSTSAYNPLNNPIIMNPNNITIMNSIMLYNKIISQISNHLERDSNNIYPQAVYGVLDNLDNALQKLRSYISINSSSITSSELSDDILNKKILTKNEITANLIGILNEATLYNCISCLDILHKKLTASGEILGNILFFAGTSEKDHQQRELLRHALLIAKEKIMKNK